MTSDLHDRLFDEISSRLHTLRSGALAVQPDGSAWSQEDVMSAESELERDLGVLKEHWRIMPGVAGLASENHPVTASCGNAQPCPHVLGLAEKYSVSVVA
jgi:hypothetical protein